MMTFRCGFVPVGPAPSICSITAALLFALKVKPVTLMFSLFAMAVESGEIVMRFPDRDTSRLSLPGPISETPLVSVTADDQEMVPLPAVTLILSPREADDRQDLIDVSSGVLVHVGLDPVQAASAEVVHQDIVAIRMIPRMCMVLPLHK
jgi:hypothetical protein